MDKYIICEKSNIKTLLFFYTKKYQNIAMQCWSVTLAACDCMVGSIVHGPLDVRMQLWNVMLDAYCSRVGCVRPIDCYFRNVFALPILLNRCVKNTSERQKKNVFTSKFK